MKPLSAVGAIPFLGTLVNTGLAAYHGTSAVLNGLDGNHKGVADDTTSAIEHAFKAVPGLGTALTVGQFFHDGLATEDGNPKKLSDRRTVHEKLRDSFFGDVLTQDESGASDAQRRDKEQMDKRDRARWTPSDGPTWVRQGRP